MVRARKSTGVSDLPSTGYGDKAALEASTAEVPMGEGGPAMVGVDEIPNLSAPSSRPGEPLTTGLPTGAGEGPEALGVRGSYDPVRRALQAMLVVSPNNDVMRLLDMLDIQGR